MGSFVPLLGDWFWWVVAGVLLLLELMAPGMFFIWFALAAGVVGIIDLIFSFSWQVEIVLFAALFFLMIWPQMRQQKKAQKERDEMMNALAKGDEVVFGTGLLGKVSKLGDTYVSLELAAGVEVQAQRSAITQVLPKGTAYQTDAGACADYNSVIGFDPTVPLTRFVQKIPAGKMEPALGPATVCGVFVETDDKTGLATRVAPIRLGGRLIQATVG